MKCILCNENFKSQRSLIYHIKKCHNLSFEEYIINNENIEPKKCEYCNKTASFNIKLKQYRNTCSDKSCIGKYAHSISIKSVKQKYGVSSVFALKTIIDKSKNTKKERYGDEKYNNQEKNKHTCLQKYGVDNVSKSKNIKDKISKKYKESNKEERILKTKKTNFLKYGVEWNTQSNEIKNIIKTNNIKKYGVNHPMKNKDFFEKRKLDFKEKFGVEFITQKPEIGEKIKNTKYEKAKEKILKNHKDIVIDFPEKGLVTIKCPNCNKTSTLNSFFLYQRNKFNIDLCLHCTPYKIPSYTQKRIAEWIKSLGIEIIEEYKIPNTQKFIDIYVPKFKIGIEYNGVFWHSEKFRDIHYHINKKIEAHKNDINLINIWEDDFIINETLIKNRLLNLFNIHKIKIGARKCIVKTISNKESINFLNEHHIQGYIPSNIIYGLFYNNELVSLISFGRRNGLKYNEIELLRYVVKDNYMILGGFNKLFNKFLTEHNPYKVITYLDLDWANFRNNIYENNGFTFIKQTPPNYFYIVKGKRESRQKYQKFKLIKQGYDKNKTEVEIMKERGILRIWNTGNLKYEWINKSS
jgi:hypothetical protein